MSSVANLLSLSPLQLVSGAGGDQAGGVQRPEGGAGECEQAAAGRAPGRAAAPGAGRSAGRRPCCPTGMLFSVHNGENNKKTQKNRSSQVPLVQGALLVADPAARRFLSQSDGTREGHAISEFWACCCPWCRVLCWLQTLLSDRYASSVQIMPGCPTQESVVYRHRIGTRCACTALCMLLSAKLKLVDLYLVVRLALPRSPHLMPQGWIMCRTMPALCAERLSHGSKGPCRALVMKYVKLPCRMPPVTCCCRYDKHLRLCSACLGTANTFQSHQGTSGSCLQAGCPWV